jgi:hypothetical protein
MNVFGMRKRAIFLYAVSFAAAAAAEKKVWRYLLVALFFNILYIYILLYVLQCTIHVLYNIFIWGYYAHLFYAAIYCILYILSFFYFYWSHDFIVFSLHKFRLKQKQNKKKQEQIDSDLTDRALNTSSTSQLTDTKASKQASCWFFCAVLS